MELNPTIVTLPQAANYQLPDDSLLSFYQDLDNRVVWVSDEINSYSLEIIKHLIRWNREDKDIPVKERKPIKLLFFSPGGELITYRAIADVIKLSKTPIIGINMGMAYSAAALIFLSCPIRYMLASSSLLLHCGSSSIEGSYYEVAAAMQKYQNDIEEMTDTICSVAKYPREEIMNNLVSDWYIDAKEAAAHGMCDKIVNSVEDLL